MRKVKLERVEGGYRYDLTDKFRNRTPYCFEIRSVPFAGQQWWEVGVGDEPGEEATGMFQTLDEVRIFLAMIPSPHHNLVPERS